MTEFREILERIEAEGNGHYPLVLPSFVGIGGIEMSEKSFRRMGNRRRENHEPRRPRRLLLHRREIDRLYDQVRIRGRTVIPTKMYFVRGRAKLEIALATGKKKYDKRREIARREAARDVERALRRKGRS